MTTLSAPLQTPAARGLAPPEPFAWPVRRPLLWAEWRNLILLNFEIDPHVLEPYVPHGTELDLWEDKTYASIVGFQFLNARLFGIRIPFHADFEEVNLRFYVRHRAREGWRRGVVFIREIAPRWCVAVTARLLYGENYLCVPMTHRVTPQPPFSRGACPAPPPHAAGLNEGIDASAPPERVEYCWRLQGHDRHVALQPAGPPQLPLPGSHEQYLIEHYWGYSKLPRGRSKEYCVAHRPWRVSPAASVEFNCDVAALYGPQFAPFLEASPASAFWADGSPVRVYPGHRLA